jgi:glutamate-1-semialdehyde 2,1-aminomutase
MHGIRIARAFTGKTKIAKFEGGYHGWHDHVMWSVDLDTEKMGPADRPNTFPESAGMHPGLEPSLLMLPFEDRAFDLIRENASELAVVLIEPVLGGWTLPVEKAFLQRLREVTRQAGVLLLFDEVITGFRLALGGAQELFGVVPDIATYGKIIGGGLPIGAVGCSAEIMGAVLKQEPALAIAGSFSGNAITLAAGNAMLEYLLEHPETYRELAERGDHLRSSFDEFARKKGIPATMTGVGSMFQAHLVQPPVRKPRDFLAQDAEPMRDFQLLLRHNGVFIPRLHLGFISTAHQGREIENLLRAHKTSLELCFKVRHE